MIGEKSKAVKHGRPKSLPKKTFMYQAASKDPKLCEDSSHCLLLGDLRMVLRVSTVLLNCPNRADQREIDPDPLAAHNRRVEPDGILPILVDVVLDSQKYS